MSTKAPNWSIFISYRASYFSLNYLESIRYSIKPDDFIMKTLEIIQTYTAQFPCITNEELIEIKQKIPPQLQKIKRILGIPLSLRTIEEKKLIQEEPLLKLFLEYESTKTQFSLIEVLQDDDAQTDSVFTLLWSQIIHQFMFLDDEEESFNLFLNCDSLFYSPTGFSGLLYTFIAREYHFDQIIHSGLLQRYFAVFVNDLNSIERTYQYLRELGSYLPSIHDFLVIAQNIHCNLSPFPQMNLLGETCETALTELEPIEFPQATINCSASKFQQLYCFLGLDFLKLILLNTDIENLQEHISELRNCLNAESLETLVELFQNIVISLPAEEQLQLFLNLNPLLNERLAHELLSHKKKFFWILIATAPQIYKLFIKKNLHLQCLEHPLSPQDIQYVDLICTKNKFFSKIHEQLYFQIFNLFLQHDELELSFSILKNLKKFYKTTQWCETRAIKLKGELAEAIMSNLDGFNSEKFRAMREVFFKQQTAKEKLLDLGFSIANYPHDHYQLTSVILCKLYLYSETKNILEWVKAMLPLHIQEAEEQQDYLDHQKRLLTEWMSFTQNPEIILTLMGLLQDLYQSDLTQLERNFLTSENLSLRRLAITDSTCLSLYLNLYPRKKHLKLLTQHKQSEKSVLDIAIRNKELFSILLEILSTEDILQLLVLQNKYQQPYLFQLTQYPDIFQQLLLMLPKDTQEALLSIKNSFQENLFDYALSKPKSIQILCEEFTEEQILKAILSKDRYEFTVFENAFNHPESFRLIINALPHESLILILNDSDPIHSHTLFLRILEKKGLTLAVIQKLSQEEIIEIILHFADYLTNKKGSDIDLFYMLFQKLSSAQMIQILLHEIEENRFIHELSKYPNTLLELLKLIPIEERFSLLSLSNSKKISALVLLCKQSETLLAQIIPHIHPSHLIGFLNFELSDQRKIIDFIGSKATLLLELMKTLHPEYYLAILELKNNRNQRAIDLISLQDWQNIQLILEQIDSENRKRLITFTSDEQQDSLVVRSVHFPETLNYFLSYLDPDEILYYLGVSGEQSCNQLHKLSNVNTVTILLQHLPRFEQTSLLIHKHKRHQTLLQFCFNEPNCLLEFLDRIHPETLDFVHQKIISQQLNCKALLSFPAAFHHLIIKFSQEQQKSFLAHLCQVYPETRIHGELKQTLSNLFFKSKGSHYSFFHREKALISHHNLMRVTSFRELGDCILPSTEGVCLSKAI
jgi:hypothetical protein